MFKKILIPTDGSPLATQAAKEGVELAKKVGAEVVSVFVAKENQPSVFEFSQVKPAAQWPTVQEYEQAVKDASKEFMAPLRAATEAAGLKFTAETFISNATAPHIVNTAEKHGCDLIYMGSKGCAGWERLMLGSVASKVMTLSPIPVLVYKVKKEQVPSGAKIYAANLTPMV